MDVVLTMTQSRGGVRLYHALDGAWVASGTGTSEDEADGCTLTRATKIGVEGRLGASGNGVTLLHNQSAQRALLNFSVSKGEGVVTATTRYCDGSTIAKDTKYFWGIADSSVEVRVEPGPIGATRYIVSKEETAPCGAGATCTRTATGVLQASPGVRGGRVFRERQKRLRVLRMVLSVLGAFAGAFLGVMVSAIVWPDQVPGIGFTAGAALGFMLGRVVR